MTSSPTLITDCPVNKLPNKLAANLLNDIPRNLPFYSFSWFLSLSLIPFIRKPDSSSDLAIYIIASIYSFEIINAVVPDP